MCKGDPRGSGLNRCPMKIIDKETARISRFVSWVNQGVLPTSGGLTRQPAKLIEAIEIFQAEYHKVADQGSDG